MTPPAATSLADSIRDVEHLEELLSEPSAGAVEALARLPGDLVVLGVGGKMGPTLARMARRVSDAAGVRRRVFGVARFSSPGLADRLRAHGVEPVRCDLLDPGQLDRLPDADNVVAMLGMKFGSTGQEALTWAMNSHLPAVVCARYRKARVVAFSTGNVYGLSPVHLGGSRETDPPRPAGEYSMSCLGRERMYEYFSRTWGMPMALLRLNYACELRYGVLVDIARKVQSGEPIDLAMGHFNVVWQGDANAMALCAFAHLASPPTVLNLAGPELLSVWQVAEEFGRLLDRPVSFRGSEAADAFLSNAQKAQALFGYPRVPVGRLIGWVADWVKRGGASLDRPTHFEVRDGHF
jgi:nucleoside-diphosphate-sugar epimerase